MATLTLSNAGNSFSQTDINGGTLSIGLQSYLGGSTQVTFSGTSILQFNLAIASPDFSIPIAINTSVDGQIDTDGNNSTISSIISGAGTFEKVGAGTLILTGMNTYMGGVFVSAGTLQGNTNSLLGDIDNVSAVVFDQSVITTGTYAGSMTGSGSLSLINGGTLILTGTDNNYSGGTTVSAGTLQGDTNTVQGDIVNNSAVVFAETINGQYSGTMSGSGTLTKQNTGLLSLSGSNSYMGGTHISAGTVLIGSTANLGTGGVTFSGTSALQFSAGISGFSLPITINSSVVGTVDTGNNTSSISSQITGPGIFQAGVLGITGTLNLSNATNNYSGGTQIPGGTLQAGAASVIPASGIVTIGSTAKFDLNSFSQTIGNLSGVAGSLVTLGSNTATTLTAGDSTNQTFNGVMSGSGGFIKQGSGTLIFGGANTYAPAAGATGTAIHAGTLQAGAASVIPSTGVVAIANAATFNLNGFSQTIGNLSGTTGTPLVTLGSNTATVLTAGDSSNQTFNGVISGSGRFTKQGTGTLIFGGANTYTPAAGATGTAINAGTLQAGAANVIPSSGVVAIANASTFDLNSFSQTIGNLSGAVGSIVDLGSATLTAGDSSNHTFSGVIEGPGGNFTKQGTGILSLTGNNTYTGATMVNQGQLTLINAMLASATTTVNGATLSGTGTLQAVDIVGGTIKAGNSIGDMHMSTFSSDSSSTIQVEIDPSTSSKYIISGGATLGGGQIQVIQDGVSSDYPAGQNYPFLTAAGGITGTFNPTVIGGLPGFTFTLDYTTNTVTLIYGFVPPPPTPTKIATAGLTGNAAKFARYLNKNVPNSAATKALAQLSGQTLAEALNSASPARNAFATLITQNVMFGVSQLVSSHLVDQRYFHTLRNQQPTVATLFADNDETRLTAAAGDCCDYWTDPNPCNRYSFWIDGFGEYAHLKAQNQNPAFNAYSGAAMLGVDVYSQHNLFGIGGGYAYTHLVENNDAGNEKINYYFANLYDTVFFRGGYVEFGAWGAYNQIHNYRNISFPGFNATASSTINSWQLVPHLGFGISGKKYCWGYIEPFAQADCAINWQQSFHEHGAGPFDMRQTSRTSELLRAEGGLRFYESRETCWGAWMIMEKISYVYQKSFHAGRISAAIVGTPALFTAVSFQGAQNMGSAGLEFLWRFGKIKPVTFSLVYDGEWGSKYMSHEGMVKLCKDF